MSRVLLYYPTIDVPNNEWLRGAILYTDKIASISPFKGIDDNRVSETMKSLFDKGLYEPISVFEGIDIQQPEYKEFEAAFLNAISTEEFDVYKKKRKKNDRLSYDYRNYELYIQKISHNILDILKDKKLFTEDSSKRMLFDRKTAFLYMSMLSDYIAKVQRRVKKNHVIPATDDPEIEAMTYKFGADPKEINAYEIVFNDCLPKPKENVTIEDIIEFKKEREHELANFRKEIEAIEKVIRDAKGDEYLISQIREGTREKLFSSVKTLRKEMRKAKMDSRISSFSTLATFKPGDIIPTVSSVGSAGLLGTGASELIQNVGEPNIKSIFTVGAGLVLLIVTSVAAYYKRNLDTSNNALSYLYFAKKKGIIK